jgi:hypothetical protein
LSGDDSTQDLALMVKRFEKKFFQKSKKLAEKCPKKYKSDSGGVSGELEFKTPVEVVALSQRRPKFCPSLGGEKH